jgi:hypothetical protein
MVLYRRWYSAILFCLSFRSRRVPYLTVCKWTKKDIPLSAGASGPPLDRYPLMWRSGSQRGSSSTPLPQSAKQQQPPSRLFQPRPPLAGTPLWDRWNTLGMASSYSTNLSGDFPPKTVHIFKSKEAQPALLNAPGNEK